MHVLVRDSRRRCTAGRLARTRKGTTRVSWTMAKMSPARYRNDYH